MYIPGLPSYTGLASGARWTLRVRSRDARSSDREVSHAVSVVGHSADTVVSVPDDAGSY